MPMLRLTLLNTHSTQTHKGNKTYHETLPTAHNHQRGSEKFTKLPEVTPEVHGLGLCHLSGDTRISGSREELGVVSCDDPLLSCDCKTGF